MKRNLWRFAFAALAAVLILCVFSNVTLAALDLKIGYFTYDDYLTVDEDNHITGYAGDILEMLVEANPHWNFVPVEFERSTFNENMRKGYAVLSLQTPYTAASPRFFTYSEYPIGVERGIFYTSLEQHIYYEDFTMFNGMRVGSIPNDLQNNFFDEYQAENGFAVEYVLFNNLNEMKQALAGKEIDGFIYGSVVEQGDLKIVARYAEAPLHVAGNEWGASFVEYFDRVIGNAMKEDPYFLDKLYAKYFDAVPRAVQAMTEEEERAANLARIAAEEAEAKAAAEEAAARKAEEEALRAAREEEASGTDDGDTIEREANSDGVPEKMLTQVGFIVVAALLVILLASALIRNRSGKNEKIADSTNSAKSPKAVATAKAVKTTKGNKSKKDRKAEAIREQEEKAKAKAEEEARVKAEEDARIKVEEEVKKAAEEAKKAEAEAKIKAEKDARDRLIEEARIRAQEIARFRAEEEARMKNEVTNKQNQKLAPAQTGVKRETAPTEEAGRINDGKNIVSLPGRFDVLADSDWEQEEASKVIEYTDDQIRGEIYLSGLTISLQPRYSVNQSAIVGAEVSISCRHPIRDRVYPDELVQSLTQKDKLYILDRYIFESLCLCKPHEKVNSFEEFEIVIPVFTESVLCTDFSQWYIETAKKYQIPPESFRLDLVYRWKNDQDQHVYEALRELSEAGFKVALKDVGYANYPLELLSEVELEAIVVSEQLIVDALSNERKRKLLVALKGLCTQMNFRMEADRIDSREKLQLTTKVGCQIFQGNFLTRAIPFEQFWDFTTKLQTRIVS